MEWYLTLDNLNALHEWDVDIVDCVLVNLVQKYQDPTRAPGLLRTEKGHVWINHAYLLKQLPFLKIGVQALKKRFRHLVDVGLLERELLYPQTEIGIRKNACYRVSESFVEMCQYFKEIQAILSDKELGEKDKQGKLDFLLKEKPEVSRRVMRYPTGKKLERDGKGHYRRVTDYPTSGYPVTLRRGNELPYIPPLDPNSKNSSSNLVDHPDETATRPPGPGIADAPEPAASGEEGKSNERKSKVFKDIERVKQMLEAEPDLHERCKIRAHFRGLDYDV
ncbi:hypothetical protein ES708_21531 [subsurface metagenome]